MEQPQQQQQPTASPPPTASPAPEGHDHSSSSSQSSNADNSTLCFESSFRLETPFFTNEKTETEKHPKGKRKRTTSQDKTILEAAYTANPKPDKAARLDIVKRVSLNEKEVQIWFQNRRQNDRRKSRPLSPQEIQALRYGTAMRVLSTESTSVSIESVTAPSSFPTAAAEGPIDPSADAGGPLDLAQRPPTPGDTATASRPPSPPLGAPSSVSLDASAENKVAEPVAGTPPPPPARAEAVSEPHPYSQASSTSVGYLANRRNVGKSFSTPSTMERSCDDSFRYGRITHSPSSSRINDRSSRASWFSSSTSSAVDNSPSILHPPWSSSSSQVRLTLSLDGKAELISTQPSPPRPHGPLDLEELPPVRSHRPLQRSRSSVSSITLPPISMITAHLNAPFPPSLARGRSRDVQAWELCCAADTRDELTRLAESEASGSAVAAISLMRSSSSSASLNSLIHNHQAPRQPSPASGVLQPNPRKQNAMGAARGSGNRKPKLSRAASSVARLQSLSSSALNVPVEGAKKRADGKRGGVADDAVEPEKKKRKKPGHSTNTLLVTSGDSDKENWGPDDEDGTTTHHHHGRPPRPLQANGLPVKENVAASEAYKNPRRVGRVFGEREAITKRFFVAGVDAEGPRNHRANTAPTPGRRLHIRGEAEWAVFEDGKEEREGGDVDSDISEGEEEESKEVEQFMRGGGGELSPSKRPDMDCVAGLLKLSQGNWR
ncbi:hypothetical protein F5Y17DRAFT_439054 [Xylariaceae sp. FL0594]|nr:hypothetical protein F5Y17DRAFT_439054 [Xylariaceae sp. FL0594]